LINSLWHEDADFYIHVDAKSSIDPFLIFPQKSHVHFIKKREKVYWGAYSIVQATINGLKEILNSGTSYDYINLLSGQDYPLLNVNLIHRFFFDHPGKAFMEFYSVKNDWQEAIPRLQKYYLSNYPFRGSYLLERVMNFILPERTLPNHLVPVGRSQWFTISSVHAQYIIDYLKRNKNVGRFFRFTWGSDEIIFQTILFNSGYREDMVNDNLRYIDWSEGMASPKVFTIKDVLTLQNCGKLFARKFNITIDFSILDYLDEMNGRTIPLVINRDNDNQLPGPSALRAMDQGDSQFRGPSVAGTPGLEDTQFRGQPVPGISGSGKDSVSELRPPVQ
jgi:hypothetical protein